MFAPNLLAQADPEVWERSPPRAPPAGRPRRADSPPRINVSPAVLIAHGTQLTNKYAEGYPGKRYYGAAEYVDMVETIAIERAGSCSARPGRTVQPHSGSQATRRFTPRRCGRATRLLGMSLAHGGHLTHGSPVNYSGKLYKSSPMASARTRRSITRKPSALPWSTGRADRDRARRAYAPAIDWKRFRAIADQAGALLMADMAHYAGLIAAGLYPSSPRHCRSSPKHQPPGPRPLAQRVQGGESRAGVQSPVASARVMRHVRHQ